MSADREPSIPTHPVTRTQVRPDHKHTRQRQGTAADMLGLSSQPRPRPRLIAHDGLLAADGLTMLAHITFHNENRTSQIDFVNYNAVLATLEEMETGYTAFRRIDVVIDSNPINAFVRHLGF